MFGIFLHCHVVAIILYFFTVPLLVGKCVGDYTDILGFVVILVVIATMFTGGEAVSGDSINCNGLFTF